MEENEVIDVDALFGEAYPVEQTPADETPTVPALPNTPPEGKDAESGAPKKAEARVPPSDGTTDSEQPKPTAVEESELAKLKNDLALAKKAQAAGDRKLAEIERQKNALAEAKHLEWQHMQEAIASGTLTTEDVAAGSQRMDAWVARREAEAAGAAAETERQQQSAAVETVRAEREAELYFKEQAIPLLTERITLGLSDADVNPETLLRQFLDTPDRQADIALTWRIADPTEQARITKRVMDGALADAKAEMATLAAAKVTTEGKKAARTQFDRSTAAGPATGGRDPLPTFTSVDDDLESYYAQQARG